VLNVVTVAIALSIVTAESSARGADEGWRSSRPHAVPASATAITTPTDDTNFANLVT
jgi:hypothetical protein